VLIVLPVGLPGVGFDGDVDGVREFAIEVGTHVFLCLKAWLAADVALHPGTQVGDAT
jgi:hypothetical protein